MARIYRDPKSLTGLNEGRPTCSEQGCQTITLGRPGLTTSGGCVQLTEHMLSDAQEWRTMFAVR